MSLRVAVTGASGFVGRRLQQIFRAAGHSVITLGRSDADRVWDPMGGPAPVGDVDAVVHLAGEPIGEGRWTRRKMAAIRDSRVEGTRNLVAGMRGGRARVLVSASAAGYYGDRGDEELTEDKGPGSDFLADVCVHWEARARESGVRTVLMRTAMAIGPGGALAKLVPVFSKGLGGRFGSGRQWMSWIHRDDLAWLYLRAVEDGSLSGALNATSPAPLRSADFTSALARTLGKPAVLRIPRLGLRLAIGRAASVVTASQCCVPARAARAGFRWRWPELGPALADATAALRPPRQEAS